MIKALLFKEWIKWRPFGFLPLLGVAGFLLDYALTQRAILRIHGTVDTWVGVLLKEQQFYDALLYVLLASALFWALLGWVRERVDARVRLTYSMPISTDYAVAVMAGFGFVWVGLAWLLIYVGIYAINEALALPGSITKLELASLIPWLWAGLMMYAGTVALIIEKHRQAWVGLGVLLYTSVDMLTHPKGWTTFEPTWGLYAFVTLSLMLGIWKSFESWRVKESVLAKLARWGLVVSATLMWSYSFNHVALRVLYHPEPKTFVNFSPTLQQFVERRHDKQRTVYQLRDGALLAARDYREALPFSYRQDLVKWGLFPVAVPGAEPITELEALSTVMLRLRARDTNALPLTLWPLIDKDPVGAKLNFSPFLVQVHPVGMTVLDSRTSQPEATLTEVLSAQLDKEEVSWPVSRISANPTPLKPYEAGIWFVDAKHRLFRLVLTRQVLILKRMGELPGPVQALRIEETAPGLPMGLLVSEGTLYVLYDDHWVKTALQGIRPDRDDVMVWSTPRYVEVTRTQRQADLTPQASRVYVLSPEGKLQRDVTVVSPPPRPLLSLIQSVISPLGWTPYTPVSTQALHVWRVDWSLAHALIRLVVLNLLWVGLGVANRRFKSWWWTPRRFLALNAITLVGGLAGALALWCFTTREPARAHTPH